MFEDPFTALGLPVITWAFVTFVALSWLLHYFPSLFHGKGHKGRDASRPDPRFTVANIAHRGCRLEGLPENTLAAFQHAVASGAHLVEFDVWLTADEEVVVFHDHDLERMTGVSMPITELCYDQLPPILHDPSQHWAVSDDCRDLACRIPRLDDVLDALPHDMPMIIELKHKSKRLIERVHDLVSRRGRTDRVIWFSLQEEINADLREHDPSIPTITSVTAMLRAIALYYLGLLPFVALPDDIMGVTADEVNFESVRELPLFNGVPDFICHLLAAVLGGKPPRPLIPPGMFAHLRKRGIPIFLLGVNEEAHVQVAAECGVTAVLTDRPLWLNNILSSGTFKLQQLSANAVTVSA